MRKLATIRQISDIRPIPDADSIECAILDGWAVVVNKGLYQVGDEVVYLEVDSFVPNAIAPFLTKGDQEPKEYNGVKGERLRTIKLRGQISQGLVLPRHVVTAEYKIGDDVTAVLGIQKYEPPIPAQLAGQVKGSFPSVFPKTDEERCQNLTKEWDTLSTLTYEVTEKLEGSSMSCGRINGEFIVCSRNQNLVETEGNSLWAQARRYDIEAKMIQHNLDDYIFQGELVGEGIQGNHYKLKGQDFYVFAVYNVKLGQYVCPSDRYIICDMLGLKHVPIIKVGFSIAGKSVQDILTMADGKSAINSEKLREGLVFKQANGQAHWKAVSNQYLFQTKT